MLKALRILVSFLIPFGIFSGSSALAAEKSINLYSMDDVDSNYWAYDALERFLYADIIDGYVEKAKDTVDGNISVSIKPDNTITRAQFTKILVNAMNLKAVNTVEKSFPDVKPADWYYEYVQIASSRGIVNGKNDGTFHPHDKITRDQMAVMIYRAFQPSVNFSALGKAFPDVPKGHFAYEAIVKTAAAGIVQGYGAVFKPGNDATRAQAAVMIDRALHLETGTNADKNSVIQTVNRNIADEMKFTEQKNIESLRTLYRDTTIGYHLAYSLDSINMVNGAKDFDGSLTMEQAGEPTIKAVSVNKRFAEARIDNLRYKLSMSEPDMSLNMTIDMSGTAYLKKSDDGIWRIYNIVLDEDDCNCEQTEAN